MKLSYHVWARKPKGSMLMETAIGFGVLIIVSLLLMKMSMIALSSRSWTVRQTLSDAYCGQELAMAKRIPFANLTATDSPWPTYPAVSVVNNVVLGTLGNGAGNVTGTIKRFKEAATNNMATNEGSGSLVTNPSNINSYLLQSVLTYEINGKTYYKTRSAIRTQ